jgi:hypothetical protein
MADETTAPTPQTALCPLTSAAIFLVVTIDPGGEAVTRDPLSDLNSLQRFVGFRAEPEGRLILRHRCRLRGVGPVVRRTPSGGPASVP